ncbi:MAG TPA: DUF2304 domain-containing protein [Nocardioidaceae bacterium]|nr:DUF2304 domain-containing protein [Nocardioidaceae bacterium]
MIIQVFLIGSVVAVLLYLMRSTNTARHLAVRRLAGIGFASCWAVAVIAPDVVTEVANVMGVGRGTDLVLYVLVVTFLFATVAQHQHRRDVEERLAQLTRELALRSAVSQDLVTAGPVSPRSVGESGGHGASEA